MQKKENNDIIKDLTKAKKRIDKQKEDLTNELKRLEAEIEEQKQEKKPSREAFNLNAILNKQTPEEIKQKIAAIKQALALPYYADSEYRKLSIAYLENITEAEKAELENNEKEIEAAENIIAEAEAKIAELKQKREDIKFAASDKIEDIGLLDVACDMMDFSPEHILNKYKQLCSKYN